MEKLLDNTPGITITIISVALFLFKSIAPDLIIGFIKEIFRSKTKKSAGNIFNSLVIALLIIGIIILSFPYFINNTQPKADDQENTQTTSQKTNAEVALETGTLIYNEVKNGINENKAKKDSIKANREKRLVFQIGEIKDNEDAILKLYNNLKSEFSIDLSRIFVFKIQKNSFFLYKDDNYTTDQINDSLLSFKSKLNKIEPNVKIVNLMDYCKVKENIKETKPLKFRKEKIEIPCCNCDK